MEVFKPYNHSTLLPISNSQFALGVILDFVHHLWRLMHGSNGMLFREQWPMILRFR